MKTDNLEETLDNEFDELFENREKLRYEFCKSCDVIGKASTYVPVNLFRLVPIIMEDFNIKPYSLSDMSPLYVIEKVKQLFEDITKLYLEKEDSLELHKVLYHSFLASKRILSEFRLNKVAFDFMIEKVRLKIY